MLAMSTFVSPQIFLVSLLAGWLNQEQQKVLEYLQEENRVLKAQLGQRLRLSDEQRRRLAAKGWSCARPTPRFPTRWADAPFDDEGTSISSR